MATYFFPTPYEDELLYSILARYSVQSGNTNDIQIFDDIFGSRNVTAPMEIQGRLNTLISNLPINSKFTAEHFIFKHTLFPYLAAFVERERAEDIINIMKDGDLARVYNKMGITANKISQNVYFRFCPECMREDLEDYGETYWHRVHQVTGVLVCPKHRMPTYNSTILTKGKNRQSYIPANPNNLLIDKEVYYSKDIFDRLYLFAKDVEVILNKKYSFQDIRSHKYIFMSKMIEKDIANLNTMVHQKRLRKLMIDFWGEEVLDLLQNRISINKNCYWLEKLVIDSHTMSNPIRNILLIRALDIEVKDVLDGNLDMNNTLSHKDIWISQIMELIPKGLSLREMSKLLDTTSKTLKKYIEELEIEPFWKYNGGGRYFNNTYKSTKEFEDRRENARNKWLEIKRTYPNLSRYKLKIKNESLFTWLQRYDKDWLWVNSSSNSNENSTTIWAERDKEYLPKIQEVVEEMIIGNTGRICWYSVGGKLGINGWLLKGKDRLPMINQYINTVIETYEEYRIRRIKWALEELEIEGETITKWKLIEKSGVNQKYLEPISKPVADILNENGYDYNLLL